MKLQEASELLENGSAIIVEFGIKKTWFYIGDKYKNTTITEKMYEKLKQKYSSNFSIDIEAGGFNTRHYYKLKQPL